MRVTLVLAVVCSLLGCGGDGGSSGPMDMADAGSGCTFRLSGGYTATGTCKVAAFYNPSYGSESGHTVPLLEFAIRASSINGDSPAQNLFSDYYFTFSSQLSSTNNFREGTYNQGTVGRVTGWAMAPDGSPVKGSWQVVTNNGVGPDQGSFTLDISSTGPTTKGANGAMWLTEASGPNGAVSWTSPHGTLNATMPAAPGSGATGTVTAQVTF